MSLLVDPGAVLLREDAEVADQFVGRREPLDVPDLGDQDRVGPVGESAPFLIIRRAL